MSKKTSGSRSARELRQVAEARLASESQNPSDLAGEKLQHEYQVYAIELEMQNEALRQSQIDLEKSRDLYLDLYDFSPVGYLTLTSRGKIVESNLTAARLLGRERARLIGQPLFRCVAGDAKHDWYTFLQGVIESGPGASQASQEIHFERSDGSKFFARLDCLYQQRDDEVPSLRVCMLNIGEFSSAQRAVQQEESSYRALYESMRDAFARVDMAGTLKLFNKPFQDMLGYSERELKDKTYFDLTPEKWHAFEARIIEEQVLPFGESQVYEKEYITKQGQIIPVELKAVLIKNEDGQGEGIWAVVRDISLRKLAEAKLAESEARYRIAMQAISGVVYDWNIVTDEATFTERLAVLLGETLPYGVGVRDWWRAHVHPEDYPRLKADVLRAMTTQNGLNNSVYRVRHRDGHWVHVSDRGFVLCNDAGVAVRMIGSLSDISARVRAETALRTLNDSLEEQVVERSAELRQRAEQLHESERFIRTTLDTLSCAVAVIDETEQIILTNKAWRDFNCDVAVREGKQVGCSYLPCTLECRESHDALGAHKKICCAVQSMLAGKRQSYSLEYPCKVLSDTRWFSIRIDRFKGNASLWLVITHDEITERKQTADELSRVATNFKKMLRKVELAHEEDSKQIAREVHDQLGATLTMLKLGLATSMTNVHLPEQLKNKVDGMIDLADQALQSVKRVAARLRPGMLDTLGLVAALKWHVKEFTRMTGIAVEVQMPDYVKLTPERGNAVFRIIQESLTNIAKHSHASKVNILGRKTKRNLIFVVTDNGIGFPPKESHKRDSFGIIGMEERAIYLGGKMSLDNLPDGGMSMTLQVPMEVKAKAQEEDLFS
jgi:PAS domain S-box-containing protein